MCTINEAKRVSYSKQATSLLDTTTEARRAKCRGGARQKRQPRLNQNKLNRIKTKTKAKARTQTQAKTQTQTKAKAKAKAKTKTKTQTQTQTQTKAKTQTKTQTETKTKTKTMTCCKGHIQNSEGGAGDLVGECGSSAATQLAREHSRCRPSPTGGGCCTA
jgi:hypothetical protein